MCKFNPKIGDTRIDPCLINLISFLNENFDTTEILACCCGHSKYPITIVARNLHNKNNIYELLSGITIPRKRKFYKKDKQGYYYIPEVGGKNGKKVKS